MGATGARGARGDTGFIGATGVNYSDYIYWNNSTNLWSVDISNVHIGSNAGRINQGEFAVAIGRNAGQTDQGTNSIAIGRNANVTGANNIFLNATGAQMATFQNTNAFYVNPIRTATTAGATGNVVIYDGVTKEITNNQTTFITPTGVLNTFGLNVSNTSYVSSLSEKIVSAAGTSTPFVCDYSSGGIFRIGSSVTGVFTVNINNIPVLSDATRTYIISLLYTPGGTTATYCNKVNLNASTVSNQSVFLNGGTSGLPSMTTSTRIIQQLMVTYSSTTSTYTIYSNVSAFVVVP